jgi:hypothetical protein
VSHMVIFRTPEGKPGYQPAETVNDAVAVVERLRNDEGVENVRIFRLEEVQFELRPYFRVELAGAGGEETSASPAIFGAAGSPEVAPESDTEPDSVDGGHDSFAGSADDRPDETGRDGADDTAADSHDSEHHEEDADAPAPTMEVPPPPSAAHPPWAAPPPPPPAPVEPPVGEPVSAEGDGDEFSGIGQRRGLFGR